VRRRLPTLLLAVLAAAQGSAAELPARRIVSLAPHGAELVYAAGAGQYLLASVAHSDYPPAALELPRIGDAASLDRERLLGLQPDLVIAWPLGNRSRDLDWLQGLGIRVYRSDPQTLEAIADDLEAIGRLAGTEASAEPAAEALRHRLQRLRVRYHRTPPLPVFYQLWPQPLMSVDGQHLISRVLALCGGRNIFDNLPAGAAQVSREAVLAADPQAIVATYEYGQAGDPLAQWHRWPTLTAVREDRLILLPADLMHRPGPRLLDGAQKLCERLAVIPDPGLP
jgi:iron complex transport system substrate-binding protein